MMKSISRVLMVALAAVLSLGIVGTAAAQYGQSDPLERNASAFRYEPPVATANTGFLGLSSVNPQATPGAAAAGGTGGGTTGGLAITGSETEIPLAIGTALVALGGISVVAARKRNS